MSAIPHGTYNGYSNYGCRCEGCRAASRRYRHERQARGLAPGDSRHGTANGYNNCGCRCDACKRAFADLMWRNGYTTRYRRSRGVRPVEVYNAERRAEHGTESRYKGGCRCVFCMDASAEARRVRRAANDESRLRANAKRLERYYAAKARKAAA